MALRARGLRATSSADGLIAPPGSATAIRFRPQVHKGNLGGQMQGVCISRNASLTTLSSME
jgi:hypothetical protein